MMALVQYIFLPIYEQMQIKSVISLIFESVILENINWMRKSKCQMAGHL